MAYTTFNRQINDQMKEPMFFGNPVNVSRYDQQKYGIFEKLIEKQLSFFWRPEEVDVSKDRIDYQNLPEHEKHIFISNLLVLVSNLIKSTMMRLRQSVEITFN